MIFLNECLYIINVYFDRTDVSEGIDVNKTSSIKECDISIDISLIIVLLFN